MVLVEKRLQQLLLLHWESIRGYLAEERGGL